MEKESPGGGQFHYPSIIQSADGTLHATYSFFVTDAAGMERKSIKYATFNVDWLTAAEPD